MLVVNITAQPNQQRYWAATTQGTCRAGQNHIYIYIYGVHTAFLAGKSPNIRSYTVYIYSSGQPYIYGSGQIHNHVQHLQQWTWLGLARTICIWCTYGIFGREITKFTFIYAEYARFWPTLHVLGPTFVGHAGSGLPMQVVCDVERCECGFSFWQMQHEKL